MNPFACTYQPLGAIAIAALLCCTSSMAQSGASEAVEAELLRTAQMWSGRQRADLARQSIEKLLSINPRSPQGLAALGDIALQEGKTQEAQSILARLQSIHPSSQSARDLAALINAYGPGKQQLAQMRLMARAGRKAEAAAIARQLFPAGPPQTGSLMREYYQIIGGDPESSAQPANAQNGAQPAAPNAARTDPATDRVSPQSGPPRDQQAQAARDPASVALRAGLAALDKGELEQAERSFDEVLQRRPRDAQALGSKGLLRMRQGRHAEALPLLDQAYAIDRQGKWRDLRATAQFWAHLRAAEAALQADDLAAAQQLSQQALQQQPDNLQALMLAGEIKARRQDAAGAEAYYRQALRSSPGNVPALTALADLYATQGHPERARQLLEQTAQQQPGLARDLQPVQARVLDREANTALEAGQLSKALGLQEQALKLTPADPWLRHRLARTYLRMQQPASALQVMDAGIALAPAEPDMRYARALIRSAVNDDEGALFDMRQIPEAAYSESMRNLRNSAQIHAYIAQTARDPALARARLDAAERAAGNDSDLLYAVSSAWFRMNRPQEAVAVFDRRMARLPAPEPADRLRQAQLLGRAAEDSRLQSLLPQLLARKDWTAEQDADLLGIQADYLERQVDLAMAQARPAQARRLATSPLHQGRTTQAQRSAARARLMLAANENAAALEQFDIALKDTPDSYDLHIGRGNALARMHQLEAARSEAQWAQQRAAGQEPYRQLALVRLWQRAGQPEQARALLASLQAVNPDDTEVLLHSARLERSESRYAQALSSYRDALALERRSLPADSIALPDSVAKIESDIASIEGRRQSWVEVGQTGLRKSSTDGISSLHGWERPAVAWFPRGYDGLYFLHVDQVHLDAGALPGNADDALSYGQVAAWPSARYPTTGAHSKADGYNVGFGYQADRWQWDIGTTGAGMPVTNVVGGIAHTGDWRDIGYRVEVSRRPLTGSLLSYGGAHDPITGQTWGGVVATGVSARASTDVGGFAASLSGNYAALTGKNVRSNTRWQLRAALDRDIWRTPSQVVNLGAALSFWGYARDLSEYSWGHGGYYSPQRYASISLPLQWSGREGRWTWLLRASVSYSRSSSNPTDYFPTDPQLQAQAYALGRSAVYAGGSSTGFGRSLRAVLEHQLTSNLALGAQFEMDRSAYYAPTSLMLYARFLFDPVTAPLANRPRPVQPYSSF
ncbi:cellulose synthase subunit BcsC-related outer membrane protein [Comamonas terrae]|uniref:Cellulose synthase subunit BcsC-related outer membrane protein n=1 Tax=Comamonas terrae TaxID=673548 RepID=A0ABW5UI98_9BURK|nr:cellulose synthase subunit BcsC-related outer membrane protein [Comamonas terrae]